MTLTRTERRALVEPEQQEVSLTAQAHILSLSRSSLYYRPVPPSVTELAAKHRIDELYLEFPYYGARRMAAQLQREGLSIDRKTARKYMQEMGLIAVYPGLIELARGRSLSRIRKTGRCLYQSAERELLTAGQLKPVGQGLFCHVFNSTSDEALEMEGNRRRFGCSKLAQLTLING